MKAIEILMEEHRYIKIVLGQIRKQCINIINGENVELGKFYEIIDFVRDYADKYHHKKEEDQLFNIIAEELGLGDVSGPIAGMLMEHDFGRAHIMELEKALKECEKGNMDARVDIIAHAIGYEQMLLKHIEKEDNAIYKYAKKRLSAEIRERLDRKFEEIENEKDNIMTRNKYMELAKSLEDKNLKVKPE